jgi:hypothetical protein
MPFRLLLIALALCIVLAACTPSPTPTPDPNALTRLAGDILANPARYDGQAVTIVGYYRGWDLLHEAEGGSPVTRSDWVVKDETGAIYVQANNAPVTGQKPNPGDQPGTNRVVRVSGAVRLTAAGQPYIEPIGVEFVK